LSDLLLKLFFEILFFAALMCLPVKHVCAAPELREEGNPVMAHYHFHWTAVQHITDLENIINALETAFIFRRPLVMVSAYKMDMTVKPACVVRDRLLIPICKIPDYIYMIIGHDNSIPVCDQRLVMLINT
jgi:hypothetical protein